MTRPENVNVKCTFCGITSEASMAQLKAAPAVVYRGNNETVRRRITCPNCDKDVIVAVPKAWLDDA